MRRGEPLSLKAQLLGIVGACPDRELKLALSGRGLLSAQSRIVALQLSATALSL